MDSDKKLWHSLKIILLIHCEYSRKGTRSMGYLYTITSLRPLDYEYLSTDQIIKVKYVELYLDL